MRYIRQMVERLKSLFRNDEGFVMMATLSIFLFLFVLCASIYAVVDTVNEKIKLQNACDAAAYSAAVVQADGLSRMATVNRAMAWTYVQMSNRQMDYITYRWLKLLCKRFEDDKEFASKWYSHLILCCDRQLGLWAILEAAVSAALDMLFEFPCDTGNHRDGEEARRYWCGLDFNRTGMVSINTHEIPLVTTYDNIKKVLRKASFFTDDSFEEDDMSKVGKVLGELIDNDKRNIKTMNSVLPNINQSMTGSMRETAENVLKSTLGESRLPDALRDRSIFIHIPYVDNPYDVDTDNPLDKSYFSPLRNTEVDERTFLQMQGVDKSNEPLYGLFGRITEKVGEVLADILGEKINDVIEDIGFGNGADGFDQWFVRGRGVYRNEAGEYIPNENKCYDSQNVNTWNGSTSGWISSSDDTRLVGTMRDEGTLGIQRVYKDSNLNELEDGIFSYPVDRGNHIMDVSALLLSGYAAFKDFLGGGGDYEPDEQDEDEVSSVEEIQEKIENKKKENQRLQEENNRLRNELSQLDPNSDEYREKQEQISRNEETIRENEAGIAEAEQTIREWRSGGGGNTGGGASGANPNTGARESGDALGGILTSIINTVMSKLLAKVDIQPSCRNKDSGAGNFNIPMCHSSDESVALVAQYRWASCKWYCLTTLTAWTYSLIWNEQKIWCDRVKKTFKKFFGYKLKARGHGHFGLPKWFCGSDSNCACADSGWGRLLQVVPPLPFIDNEVGDTHGYMMSPWDFTGFFEPISPLWHGRNSFNRDEYNSCAQFFDGTFDFSRGSNAWPGFIRGHARIYGDDKKIFDNRYVGARCKPWVLNERFFAGDGTIVVGAALVHKNPFVRLFNFLHNDTYVQGNNMRDGTRGEKKTVLSAFDIPKGNSIWTMSAARAAVRRTRRNGAFDKDRMYQITYDPLSDGENLAYVDNTQVIGKAPEDTDSGDAPDIKKGSGYEWTSPDSYDGESHLSRARDADNPRPIWNGCVCDGNERAFKNIWNLCESDWDATLLPLRYAWRTARLYNRDRKQFYGDSDTKRNYRKRRETFASLSDDYVGAGTNWVWESGAQMNSSHMLSNPFMMPSLPIRGWKNASDDYFGYNMSGFGKEPFNRLSDKDSEESARARNAFLLINNRIL